MTFLFLFFVFAFCAVYFYLVKPITLGDKLGIKEVNVKPKRYYELEFPLLGKLNYFNQMVEYASEHGAYVTSGKIAFVAVICTIIVFLFSTVLFRNIILATLAAAIIFFGMPHMYVWWLITRQREKISEQLGNVLLSLISALRAGKTLLEAIKTAAEDSAPPLGTELGKVYDSVKHGGEDLNAALKKMLARTGNHYMLQKVVLAISITRQAGGNIAGALEGINRMLDNEKYTQDFAKSHSSHGKMVAVIFNVIVLTVILNINRLMPGAFHDYFLSNFKGQVILFGCVIAVMAGWLVIFRMLSSIFDV